VAAQEAGWYGAIPLAHTQEDELEALVREHARLVYRVAFSVLRHHHDAEDAVQETFMRVLRHGARLSEVRTPKTWLARIAWRVAIDRRKKAPEVAREVAIDELAQAGVELPAHDDSADDTVLATETGKVVEQLIAGLPGKLRAPLVLSAMDEMSTTEVGEVLGLSDAAVRSRLFRAREILCEKLAAMMEMKRDQ
jgi:RNA polymerase sigma-70 factor (ECF subfamily)